MGAEASCVQPDDVEDKGNRPVRTSRRAHCGFGPLRQSSARVSIFLLANWRTRRSSHCHRKHADAAICARESHEPTLWRRKVHREAREADERPEATTSHLRRRVRFGPQIKQLRLASARRGVARSACSYEFANISGAVVQHTGCVQQARRLSEASRGSPFQGLQASAATEVPELERVLDTPAPSEGGEAVHGDVQGVSAKVGAIDCAHRVANSEVPELDRAVPTSADHDGRLAR
mmetsp:Transcript_99649/g.281242  ORF Transcript_99649/g.281242 Transcript_99649/m.281242 type:complete len:234 (-) Transcript_99649:591-1292(-)